jgi:hypothetical protein
MGCCGDARTRVHVGGGGTAGAARLSEVEGSDDGDGSKVTMGNGNGMLHILEVGRMLGTYSKMLSAETACSGVD